MRRFRLWTVLAGTAVASVGLGLIAFDRWLSYKGATFFPEFPGKGVLP